MEVILTNAEHESSLVNAFANYLEKEDYLDVTFICRGGRKVKAHQIVLLFVSPFLKEMFSERNGNEDMITITVPDVDYNVLKLLLNFLYEGTMKLSESEFVEFKAIHKMLGIRFPGAVTIERRVQKLPQKQPPPLVKLGNTIHSALQRKECPRDCNEVVKKESDTLGIESDNYALENNARLLTNPVDDLLTPDRRSRDPDDDPLNVPDVYFAVTTSGPPSQTQGVNINGSRGIVPSEGEGHNQTASSYSPAGQQGTRPVIDYSADSNSSTEQSGCRTRKRPYASIAVASNTEHSDGTPNTVKLENTDGKRVRNRNRHINFTSLTDQNADSAVDTGGTRSRRTKTRKT